MEFNATLIFEIISFMILVFILGKYAYKPLLQFLDERSRHIEMNIAEAEKNKAKTEENFIQAQKELREAREHAISLKEETKRQSEENKEKILREAQIQAASIMEQSRRDILTEIEHAKNELRASIAKTSVLIASKILQKEIREDDHKQLIEEGINNLKDI